MVIKDKTDQSVERHKARLGLTGDVYIINNLLIESLASHKRLIPSSTATTIEEAEQERIAYEAELAEQRRQAQEEAELEGETDGNSGDDL